MRRDLNSRTKMSHEQPLELFKVNVSLSQMSWKSVPQPRTYSSKASVSKAAVSATVYYTS